MLKRLRAFAQPTTCLGVAVIASIWCGVFLLTNEEHKRAYEEGVRQGRNLARVFDEYISGVITGADSVLLTLRDSYEQNPKNFDIARRLRRAPTQKNVIVQFAIVGADGRYKFSSIREIQPNSDVRDLEYFRFHANSTTDQLHISEPLVGRVSGRQIFQLTRRLTAPDGSFDGIIAASIDIPALEQFYNSIDIGHEGVISLVGFDGVIRARGGCDPDVMRLVGQSISKTKVFSLYRQAPTGEYWNTLNTTRQFEGVRRLISYRVVAGYPLIAIIGLADSDMFQQSRLTAYKYYLIALLFTAMAIAVFGIGALHQRKLRSTVSALEVSNRSLEQTNLWFNSALENMPHGLCMFDSAARLIVCNDRYRQIYNLSADVAKPGCSVTDLLNCRVANGTFVGNPEEYVADLLTAIAQGKIAKQEVEIGAGHIISVLNQPMASGGWVAIHEDISEQQRAEHELNETKQFLDSIIENIPVAVVVKDAKTRKFVLTNKAFEAMLDLSRNELVGQTAFDIYREKDAKIIDKSDAETLQGSADVNYNEYELETPMRGSLMLATKRIVVRDLKNDAKYLIVVIDDITARKKSEQRIAFMAHHDALTGLSNRVAITEKIEEAAARQRRSGEPFSIVLLDLDRFKFVNDTLGHAAGDALLRDVAGRLKGSLRETDALARLGGDEFAIIQTGEADQREAAAKLADRIIDIIAKPFNIEGNEVNIGTSIGIALAPEHASSSDNLLKMADLALYRAKSAGRNGFRFFDSEMGVAASARQELENELRRAIQKDELELHYHPIIDTKTRKICGAEALIRWRHPTKGMISPDQFIPLAEETGLITQIGEWVLLTACTEAATWPDGVKLAVNLSAVQFRKTNLPDVVMYALAQSGLVPERLELEITETALIESATECLPALRHFKTLGISIALDDFGTGYSSLSQLTIFPFDKIKIDKSFTQNMTKRTECAAIISAALTLAQSLDIATTAEGVETMQQYQLLRLAGVMSLQGYLFKRPCPASEIEFDSVYGGPEIEDAA